MNDRRWWLFIDDLNVHRLFPGWPENCGNPVVKPNTGTQRVVNGVEAIPHSWPWQVSMQVPLTSSISVPELGIERSFYFVTMHFSSPGFTNDVLTLYAWLWRLFDSWRMDPNGCSLFHGVRNTHRNTYITYHFNSPLLLKVVIIDIFIVRMYKDSAKT